MARNTRVVQVLDQAVPAERASRPRAGLNGVLAGAIGLVFSVLLAILLENRRRHRP